MKTDFAYDPKTGKLSLTITPEELKEAILLYILIKQEGVKLSDQINLTKTSWRKLVVG